MSKCLRSSKDCFDKCPKLAHPDFSKSFILDIDAGDFATRAVLSQVHEGKESVIADDSKFYRNRKDDLAQQEKNRWQ